jgi:peptide/nickel transport system permease protein
VGESDPRRLLTSLASLCALCVGAAGVWIFLAPFGHLDGLVKVPAIGAAFAICYAGLRRILQHVWGQEFDTGLWLSVIWLGALIVAAIFADFLPLGEHQDTSRTILVDGNARPDLFSKHPLGTNNQSLDVLARCIFGARVSLLTVSVAVALSLLFGGVIGVASGYRRGWVDATAGVATSAVLSFPPLILLIAVAAMFGQPDTVMGAVLKSGFALGLVGIPTMVRLARANTLVVAQREFILASRAMGSTSRRIIYREILPNVAVPVLSYAFIVVAVLIMAEGSLAFLGLGLQQPQPTWGNMIAEGGVTVMRTYPHIPLVPGVFMFLTVYSFNRIGDRARNAWDPREARL